MTLRHSSIPFEHYADDIICHCKTEEEAEELRRSVGARLRQCKLKKQEHRSFIDWFISVPAKITRSGHRTELKMYEHHFYKAAREELDRLIEAA